MNFKLSLSFFSLCVFMLLSSMLVNVTETSTGVAFAADSKKPLTIGIFPRRNLRTTLELFTPMANYLQEKLGREIHIRSAKDFKDFWDNVKQGKYDLVHYNQFHYVKSHKEFGYKVILQNEEFGSSTLSGAIYVRTDSNINSLADLKGKTIAFGGGKMAMVSYIAPSVLLKKAGLKEGVDYKLKFTKNPPVSVLGTFHREYDAGGAGDVLIKLPVVTKKVDTTQLKLLAKSDPMAHIPWAVKKDLDENIVEQIKQALLDLNNNEEGKAILNKAKLTGIHPAKDEDYNPHREMIKYVTDEQF